MSKITTLPNYKLKKPFKVSIEICADIPEISLFTHGKEKKGVFDDLRDDIQMLFEDLKYREDNLGAEPKRHLAILRGHIVEEEE